MDDLNEWRRHLGLPIDIELENPQGEKFSLSTNLTFFEGVSNRDLVILSRQIATLFEAQVSALRIFRLLAEQAEKPLIKRALTDISDDLQAGNSISKALEKHPARDNSAIAAVAHGR